ncbi:hypothetical protein [Streptomyces sp. NPDC005805]|uniref:hypothetical protein n=1 Tax=Streptomyces sp. NPDC005805 TaxID=3157068 RepID=UPI0033D11F11
MFGQRKREVHTIVVRDGDVITSALRDALEQASPEERPGLERALAVVADAALTEEETQARWVRTRLDAAAVKGPADSVPAIKALRESTPGLSLLVAVELARTTKSVEDGRCGAA